MSLKEFIQQMRIVCARRKISWTEHWWHDGIDMEKCFVNKSAGYCSVCRNFQVCNKVNCKSYPAHLKYEYQLARAQKIKDGKTGNWFMYLVKTPVAQMRADWAEYKKLGAELHGAGIHKVNMYRRIYKRFLNPDCVYLNDHCVVDYNCRDKKGNLEHRHYICQFFVNGAYCGSCHVTKGKSEYDDACAKYENLKLKKSVFWQEKFDNVK